MHIKKWSENHHVINHFGKMSGCDQWTAKVGKSPTRPDPNRPDPYLPIRHFTKIVKVILQLSFKQMKFPFKSIVLQKTRVGRLPTRSDLTRPRRRPDLCSSLVATRAACTKLYEIHKTIFLMRWDDLHTHNWKWLTQLKMWNMSKVGTYTCLM